MTCDFEQWKGSNGVYTVSLAACSGELDYTGSETFVAILWDGDDGSTPLAEIPADQIDMTDAPDTLSLTIAKEDIADLDPGLVYVRITQNDTMVWLRTIHIRGGVGS